MSWNLTDHATMKRSVTVQHSFSFVFLYARERLSCHTFMVTRSVPSGNVFMDLLFHVRLVKMLNLINIIGRMVTYLHDMVSGQPCLIFVLHNTLYYCVATWDILQSAQDNDWPLKERLTC